MSNASSNVRKGQFKTFEVKNVIWNMTAISDGNSSGTYSYGEYKTMFIKISDKGIILEIPNVEKEKKPIKNEFNKSEIIVVKSKLFSLSYIEKNLNVAWVFHINFKNYMELYGTLAKLKN